MNPKIGQIWRHHSGTLYFVYDITNTLGGKPNFPKRVSYMDAIGNRFSRTLDEWNEKFALAEEFNWQESQAIQALAQDVQALLDRARSEFLSIRMAALERKTGGNA